MRTTTMRVIASLAIVLFFSVSAFSQQVAKTISNSTSPDGRIGFLEFRPTDYGSQKHPLIIFLHGIGERGNGTSQINSVANNAIPYYCSRGASMRFTAGGQTSSFVVLSPQLSSQYGYWPPFYVKEMIKYAKANLQIDPDRIYITGLSLGGGGTWRVITDSENWDYTFNAGIAAVAPVCGTQEENDANFAATIGANHLPIWAFHCMDDGTVGVGATQHAEILANQVGLTPAAKFTYYQSGGHGGAWVNAYDTGHITKTVNGGASFTANPNMYEWFLSNKRNTGQPAPSFTAPVANAGSAQTITLPNSTVNISGSGSGTSGATISSYAWVKTSGPASGTINNATSAATSVTGLAAGTYVFTLTVTDNRGMTSSAAVTITVNAAALVAPNKTPVANAGANQTITLPTSSATLNGNASTDADGSIVAYRWTQTEGPAGPVMATRDAVVTNITGFVTGSYKFVLEVIDNGGLKGYSAVYITVIPAVTPPSPAPSPAPPPANNQTPTANAGANQTITLPASSLALNGNASKDADGSIVAYRWTQTEGPVGPVMATRDAMATSITGFVAGSYKFVLEIIDNGGLKGYAAVYITVNAAAASQGNLLGYIKMSTGPYQACDDKSSAGRTAIYGSGIVNGSTLYTDAALTKKYDGGWNWFSFTPVLGGSTTYAFAIYPSGGILLLRSCANGGARIAAAETTAEQDIATLKTMKDSATASLLAVKGRTLTMYPNPVYSGATIELNSADNTDKTIYIYNANGALAARYNWKTVTGKNQFAIKNISGLMNGIYMVEVKDATGKSVGSLKFLKIK